MKQNSGESVAGDGVGGLAGSHTCTHITLYYSPHSSSHVTLFAQVTMAAWSMNVWARATGRAAQSWGTHGPHATHSAMVSVLLL